LSRRGNDGTERRKIVEGDTRSRRTDDLLLLLGSREDEGVACPRLRLLPSEGEVALGRDLARLPAVFHARVNLVAFSDNPRLFCHDLLLVNRPKLARKRDAGAMSEKATTRLKGDEGERSRHAFLLRRGLVVLL
jgi:hypothetical protein